MGPVDISIIHWKSREVIPLVVQEHPFEGNGLHTWSPDEQWIAYARGTPDGKWDLCKISKKCSKSQAFVRRLDSYRAGIALWMDFVMDFVKYIIEEILEKEI